MSLDRYWKPLRNLLIAATGLGCLVIGGCHDRAHPYPADWIFVGTSQGKCWVERRIQGPRDPMSCTSILGYLKDDVKLPVGASVGVGVMDEKDPDTFRLIADLRGAGYAVSKVGPARRVVFPN
jgi:hypothetical protein